jgi:uncharacterized Rossmann fold enzyme
MFANSYSQGNIDKLEKYLPNLRYYLAIVKAKLFDKVYNLGRFGDGSRSIFMVWESGT